MAEQSLVPMKVDVQSLLMAAIEKQLPIEQLERLFELRQKVQAEDAKTMFFRALSLFQSKCPTIPKDKTAGSGNFTYKYAPLETIIRHISPLLIECGLSFSFDTEDSADEKTTICTIHHLAGHSESSRFKVPIDKSARMNDTQKQGSAGTYAKRYALCNALGILTGDEDNDGATATPGPAGHPNAGKKEPEQKTPETTSKPAPVTATLADGKMQVSGCVTNITKKPTSGKSFRYKIVLEENEAAPYYTFDEKIANYADKATLKGPVTIVYHVSKYGNDIDEIGCNTFVDFKSFCDKPENQK